MSGFLRPLGLLDTATDVMKPWRLVYRLDRQVHAQAGIVVTRAGLEFEIERARTGRYPAEVKITDPYTGIPLEYRREEGTLHSAGPADIQGYREFNAIRWILRKS